MNEELANAEETVKADPDEAAEVEVEAEGTNLAIRILEYELRHARRNIDRVDDDIRTIQTKLDAEKARKADLMRGAEEIEDALWALGVDNP